MKFNLVFESKRYKSKVDSQREFQEFSTAYLTKWADYFTLKIDKLVS